jgi:hypothetical protein
MFINIYFRYLRYLQFCSLQYSHLNPSWYLNEQFNVPIYKYTYEHGIINYSEKINKVVYLFFSRIKLWLHSSLYVKVMIFIRWYDKKRKTLLIQPAITNIQPTQLMLCPSRRFNRRQLHEQLSKWSWTIFKKLFDKIALPTTSYMAKKEKYGKDL